MIKICYFLIFFFFNDTATTEIYPLSLHDALPISPPGACAGVMNPGEPVTQPMPAADTVPAAREMPKSITRGPSGDSSTFEGFRSQCTTPAAWMALRLSASPAASASAGRVAIGPSPVTASASEGPATYAVASHGTALSTSASTTDRKS